MKPVLARPDMMTDSELKAELRTALGERRAELVAEREERKAIRAAMGKTTGEAAS